MPETVPENFSTTLLCTYFALVREGRKLDLPIVWLGPGKSQPCEELFQLNRDTEVWMCRNLEKMLALRGIPPAPEHLYRGLKPDVWVEDGKHAIILENKTGGHKKRQQEEPYLRFLSEPPFDSKKRAFLYLVPNGWTVNPDPNTNEWWSFVSQQDDRVLRGVIKWDGGFIEHLCNVLRVPRWFHDKLPHRVGEQFL